MLEDSDEDAGLIMLTLKRSGILCNLYRVNTGEEYAKAIAYFNPDVVLSDHSLHQFNSLEAFNLLKQKNLDIPFILVTGSDSRELQENLLKHGVEDIIPKNKLTQLPLAITTAIEKRKTAPLDAPGKDELKVEHTRLIQTTHELDHLVYGLSRHLRAPLLSLTGLINLIRGEGNPDPKMNQCLEVMNQCVCQMDVALQHALEYSHNRQEEIAAAEINLNELITSTLGHFDHLKDLKKIDIRTSIEQETPFYSDFRRLGVLLKNLLSNAITFSDHSRKVPQIGIMFFVDKDAATLVVEDNGHGIDPALQDKVFDPFFKGNEKSEGAGLGLYIVKEIVNRLHGKIQLESQLGEGTKFVTVIPNQSSS